MSRHLASFLIIWSTLEGTLRTKAVHHYSGASIAPKVGPGNALHDTGEAVRARRLQGVVAKGVLRAHA
uniref:hypothetical protein n=1 Tax=Marinobacterium profundum TaxID=1714300 RepID=UPI0013152872|nr:hypothetical protein [Marinobacterium profundum]